MAVQQWSLAVSITMPIQLPRSLVTIKINQHFV